MTEKIAAVRIRGDVDTQQKTSHTLEKLNLEKVNQAVIYNNDPSIEGMLKQAKDYITYGKVSEETLEKLEKRNNDEEVTHGTVVNLHPPKGGYKGTRSHVNQGGSLGERENLDKLLQRMV